MSVSNRYRRIVELQNLNELLKASTTTRRREGLNIPTPFAGPANQIETEIASIWQDILGVDHVGVDDTFLDLNGESIQVVQVLARIREVFSVELSISDFFEANTVRSLADLVGCAKQNAMGIARVAVPLPANGDVVITTDRVGHYLSIVPHKRRVRVATFERAVDVALKWAATRHVRAWRLTGREQFRLDKDA